MPYAFPEGGFYALTASAPLAAATSRRTREIPIV